MNSTPIHPNDLLVEGAYVGEIMDFIDINEFNEMLSVIEKVKEYSVVNRDTELHCRYNYTQQENYLFQTPLNKLEEIDSFVKENNLVTTQKWFEFKPNLEYLDYFMGISEKITSFFYPDLLIRRQITGGFTLYEDGHFIANHKDGNNTGRVCVIIMYLSSESEYNNDGGGELVIKTNSDKEFTIKPILGTFTLLDFTKNNIYHQVNEVKNGFKRYAFINFFSENN
jgi:Rps23 Pro-64 3,4-dihydroxylase Tpa1-like proline 4-hydroxylase